MAEGTIKEPFELGYCDQCVNYEKDKMGSKYCGMNYAQPIRKIKECNNHMHNKFAKLLEEFKLRRN